MSLGITYSAMKVFLLLCTSSVILGQTITQWENNIKAQEDDVKKIIDYINGDGKGRFYHQLAEFTDTYGARVCGTQALEDSIDYLKEVMDAAGFDNVHKQSAIVPGWERGEEYGWMLEPRRQELTIFGLGGTVSGTVEAEVMVVHGYDELEQRKEEVPGKIVLYNHEWEGYDTTFRSGGAIQASKHGAVASVIRSLASFSLYSPHTGIMNYNDTIAPRIPAAALTPEDADMFERMIKRGHTVKLHLHLEGTHKPNHQSYNLVADITGSDPVLKDEIVFFGGHIDSWDFGNGVQDDGIGVIMAAEILNIVKELGLKPKRTMRFIAWTCEENGLYGSEIFYNDNKDKENMVFGMQADNGLFKPRGVGFSGSDLSMYLMEKIVSPLSVIEADNVKSGGSSADSGWWYNGLEVPIVNMYTVDRDTGDAYEYFKYHHTFADHMNAVDTDELDLCQMVWTTVAYTVANLDWPLPKIGDRPTQ